MRNINIKLLDPARPYYAIGNYIIKSDGYTVVDLDTVSSNYYDSILNAFGTGTIDIQGYTPSSFGQLVEQVTGKDDPQVLPAKGYRIGFIGTSLLQQCQAGGLSTLKTSHSSKGWVSWARVLAGNLFYSPVWYDTNVYTGWEPSGTPGTSRGFNGLNAGVSGQTTDQILARKEFLVDNIDCDIVVVDGGTNDISNNVAKETIQANRETLANYYLDNGKVVILLPILARSVSSWPVGTNRRIANWINQKTRAFVNTKKNCYFYDWNSQWINSANANGEPFTTYTEDGIHQYPLGGYYVGKDFANFLKTILPPAQTRIWSQDDQFHATDNPNGNLLVNPFCTSTGGAVGTGASGTVAAGMRVERSSGTGTVVASKETRTDNRGDYQVLTITAGAGSGTDLFFFRTNAADTSHVIPGTWVQASVEVSVGAYAGWNGISMYLKDQNGTNGIIGYGLEQYLTQLWPNEAWTGTIVTPPILLQSDSSLMRWRVEIRVAQATAGTGVVKFGAIELRQVANPKTQLNYVPLTPSA